MKIIKPYFMLEPYNLDQQAMLEKIELAARTCYKSEGSIKPGSAERLVKKLKRIGHDSVLEHGSISARIICDRGVSHELVRHRIASFSQESTRYANYSKDKFDNEITVIEPPFWEKDSAPYLLWIESMKKAEQAYLQLLNEGATPQEARSVLPNSLKTELVMTANLREWEHVFKLRAFNLRAHPQIVQVMAQGAQIFADKYPALFSTTDEVIVSL